MGVLLWPSHDKASLASLSSILSHRSLGAVPTKFRLAEILVARRMSQRELARVSGISYPTINGMCTNRTAQVALATLDKLATALGIEPNELIARDPPKKRGPVKH